MALCIGGPSRTELLTELSQVCTSRFNANQYLDFCLSELGKSLSSRKPAGRLSWRANMEMELPARLAAGSRATLTRLIFEVNARL